MAASAPAIRRVTPQELLARLQSQQTVTILDVREPADYFSSPLTILGAIAIPPNEVARHLHEIPRDQLVVAFAGLPPEGASARVVRFLVARGYSRAAVLAGGFNAWEALDYPTMPK